MCWRAHQCARALVCISVYRRCVHEFTMDWFSLFIRPHHIHFARLCGIEHAVGSYDTKEKNETHLLERSGHLKHCSFQPRLMFWAIWYQLCSDLAVFRIFELSREFIRSLSCNRCLYISLVSMSMQKYVFFLRTENSHIICASIEEFDVQQTECHTEFTIQRNYTQTMLALYSNWHRTMVTSSRKLNNILCFQQSIFVVVSLQLTTLHSEHNHTH